MSLTFADLATNQELQNIVLQRRIYGKDQHVFEPFEVLFKWVYRKHIKGFSYTWPLKDNVKAIDCIIGNLAIQLKATKHVNEDKELDYLRGEIARQGLQCEAKLIVCDDDLYAKLLAKCDFNVPSVELRPYQKEFIDKHLDGILSHHISIVNCFCRFGKSYLMRYIADIFRWEVSVITTKPTETAGDYAFDSIADGSGRKAVVSIQKLKLHPEIKLHDILFVDEPQESFMTELTENTLNLGDYKHIVFFTGTSEKLESYLTESYYLAHYNFGDYIQNPVPGFPKIHFHLGASPEINEGIRLIFDRDLTRVKGRAEAAANGWKFQSAADDTDIKVSEEGTYLLISQFTTGATIPNCFIVEDRNTAFTEEDIQLIFRCFNQVEVDRPRHVYFQSVDVYKSVLTYLYRQTGKTFINTDIIKTFFKDIVEPSDIDKCDFNRLRIQVDRKGAKTLQRALAKILENKEERKKKFQRTVDETNKAAEEKRRPLTRQERIVTDHLKKAAETGEVDSNFLIFMERILSALVMSAFQQGVGFDKKNELNQDIDCVYLWNSVKDITRIKWQFLSFKFEKRQKQIEDEGEYTVEILQQIIKAFKTIIKNKFLSNVLELIQTPLSKAKYEEMCELFMTTEIEKKENAEILTPWKIAEEMVCACEQCGVLKLGCKILEPCCGKGVFLTLLLLRGYEVDFCDINPANVQFCEILTSKGGKVADALTLDYTPYDLIITNPPYNAGSKSIYIPFINAFSKAKHQCCLIPSKCLIQRTFPFCENSFVSEEFNGKMFNHVEIVTFYFISPVLKPNYIKPKVNNEIEIVHSKVNVKLLKPGNTKCYVSSYYSREGFLLLDVKPCGQWQVAIIHKCRKTFNWIVVSPEEAINNSFISILCKTEEEARDLQRRLMGEEMQQRIYKLSYSQRDITENVLRELLYQEV